MEIRKFGHSCMLVEGEGVRILIDPGSYSTGFESLSEIDGLLLTHQHIDHFDKDRILQLLTSNDSADVVADEQTAALLSDAATVRSVHEDDQLSLIHI